MYSKRNTRSEGASENGSVSDAGRVGGDKEQEGAAGDTYYKLNRFEELRGMPKRST